MSQKTVTNNISTNFEERGAENMTSERRCAPTRVTPNENLNYRIHEKHNRYTSTEDIPLTLTVDEMAEVLRIGRNTAYELLRSNQIRFFYVGRQIRIYKADLLAYMGEKES